MLVSLSIRDIVLIDRLEIGLGEGLAVLTGETGAGKSILLDAFGLALGGRGDAGLVRHGAAQGQVTAAFDVGSDHPARERARDLGLDAEGDLVLRRVQLPDGRSRAFVNEQPVGVQALRAIGAALVEIHGQHDDRALADPAAHRMLLDAYAGLTAEAASVADLHAAARAAQKAEAEQRARVEAAARDAEYLRHAAAELDKLAPEPGEEQRLAERRIALQQSEKVATELREASELLGGQGSPVSAIANAMRRLERRSAQAPHLVEAPVKALDQALIALDEAATILDAALAEADFDPEELNRIEERLFALRAAARKHQTPADALAALAESFRAQIAGIDAGEGDLVRLGRERIEREAAYAAAAKALSAKRRAAAARLDAAVIAELPPLKLERARFITEVATDEAAPQAAGIDRVEFHVQTNPGTKPGPLMKIASGGELSRFMLALKVALAEKGSAPTLVFDEIDAGVGGAVADAIGQRLARLAGRVQVLAVTHAPQVAARAGRHFLIAKEASPDGERVATRVEPLPEPRRREEIARMLAGERVTEEARAAADRLLAGAA
jgi:DNA repair protein RecN (Recombination protein N)